MENWYNKSLSSEKRNWFPQYTYPLDSAIQRLNNRSLASQSFFSRQTGFSWPFLDKLMVITAPAELNAQL